MYLNSKLDYIIMIRKKFINRKRELKFLEEKYRAPGFEFLIITGRRRIGKSRLLIEFSKKKPAIYLMCENRKFIYNLQKFNRIISEYFKIPIPNFKSFRECFQYIVKAYRRRKKLVIILDEFSYLIRRNPEIVAEFQGIVDEIIANKNIMLIICGSAVSMLQHSILEEKSPLYGRTTGNIFLGPLKIGALREWFNTSLEEIFKIYSVADAIPKYLEFFKGRNAEKEIVENIFNPNQFLFREMKSIITEEFREHDTYYHILEALSKGYTRVTEIANYTYMKSKDVASYLNILVDVGLIQKIYPLYSKTKRGIYVIKDNYTSFWFRFISQYFEEIESGFLESALSNFKNDFNRYLGQTFEKFVVKVSREIDLQPFKPTRQGKWWYKDKEIDLIALNENTGQIAFFEIKWHSFKTLREIIIIINRLQEKAKHFQWNLNSRKEYYGIVARKIAENIKQRLKQKYLLWDIRDIEDRLKY